MRGGALVALCGLLASYQAEAATFFDAMQGGTADTIYIGIPGHDAPVYVTPLYTVSPGDEVDFGSITLFPWSVRISSHGAASFMSSYKVAYGPIQYDYTDVRLLGGCGGIPFVCDLPDPVTTSLQFTLPSNASQIQLAFIGTFSSSAVVPGPIAGAGVPALLAVSAVAWFRRRKSKTA